MRMLKIVLIALALLLALFAVYYELALSPSTLVTHPKGIIAEKELHIIRVNTGWMLVIIIPTLIWLLVTAWRYNAKRVKGASVIEDGSSKTVQALCWIIPSCVIAIMTVVMWHAAHDLDPPVAIDSKKKPLVIQVVALDWKWLFIYPEQNIASLNFVQYPEKTPVQFTLTGDHAPMNSFWLPEMSGQLYAMTGMVNKLNVMADGPGEYRGRAVEINGEGYGDMTFIAKSSSQADFEAFINEAKRSKLQLTADTYEALTQHAINDARLLYSTVEKDLFEKIVMKYMEMPAKS